MTGDLHGRLVVEIERRERELPALYREPGAVVEVDKCTCYGGTLPQGHEPGCGTEPGALWFALDELARHYAHYRRVLERHAPDSIGGAPLMAGDECRCYAPYPCEETLDIAEALGIDP